MRFFGKSLPFRLDAINSLFVRINNRTDEWGWSRIMVYFSYLWFGLVSIRWIASIPSQTTCSQCSCFEYDFFFSCHPKRPCSSNFCSARGGKSDPPSAPFTILLHYSSSWLLKQGNDHVRVRFAVYLLLSARARVVTRSQWRRTVCWENFNLHF